MEDKLIGKKDYDKAIANLEAGIYKEKFEGCLFIYDENFKGTFERISKHIDYMKDYKTNTKVIAQEKIGTIVYFGRVIHDTK